MTAKTSPEHFVQRNQPEGVPPLELTGERTLPDVPEENYWYQRHLVVYEWIRARVGGLKVIDMASGEGYGADVLRRTAREVVGVEANPDAFAHAVARYPRVRFERSMVETYGEPADAVTFLQTIEHVHDPGRCSRTSSARRRRVRLDAQRAHARARGRGALGQPVAHQGVPPRRVPAPVRGALRRRRGARALPRAQARGARARDQADGVGHGARQAGGDQALLRLVRPGDRVRDFALRPADDRALDFLAVCRSR
jgi:hypothetical protein